MSSFFYWIALSQWSWVELTFNCDISCVKWVLSCKKQKTGFISYKIVGNNCLAIFYIIYAFYYLQYVYRVIRTSNIYINQRKFIAPLKVSLTNFVPFQRLLVWVCWGTLQRFPPPFWQDTQINLTILGKNCPNLQKGHSFA